MGKVLVIAEKPDAGRNMAKVLKCDNCKDGYIEKTGFQENVPGLCADSYDYE